MISGERIKQARELRGLTQSALSRSIGVDQSSIAHFETGRITPSKIIMQDIAKQTEFPISFFEQCSSVDFPLGSLLFRARKSLTLREKNEAFQYTRIIYEAYEQLESRFDKIPLRVPQLDDNPLRAASQTRSFFGLSPNTPIPNLTDLIERNGIVVLAIPIMQEKHDAFSVWAGNNKRRPVIALLNLNHGDRLRFSISHELGHIVLHQAAIGDISQIDKDANLFASEFLMPREAMLNEIVSPVTLLSLSKLKLRWKVSIQALIRRAHDLEIITPRQYKYLMQQVSKRGWRKREPAELDIPVEKPRALRKMAEMLYGTLIDFGILASNMNLPTELVANTFNAHATKRNSNDGEEHTADNGTKIINFLKR